MELSKVQKAIVRRIEELRGDIIGWIEMEGKYFNRKEDIYISVKEIETLIDKYKLSEERNLLESIYKALLTEGYRSYMNIAKKLSKKWGFNNL